MHPLSRRDFIVTTGTVAALGAVLPPALRGAETTSPVPRPQPKIPLWKGFNLPANDGKPLVFREEDFEIMAGWGFNFARLPLSYWSWANPKDWLNIREEAFVPLDRAIAYGKRHGVHVNVNLHRIPGYCVNRTELEPMQLFKGPAEEQQQALAAAVHHWRVLARRYRDIPSTELSFDLLNEPPTMPDQSRYEQVARALIAAIREESPDRLIVADGADIGRRPVLGLVDLGIVQSTRGYDPMPVSHHGAGWVPGLAQAKEPPRWPYTDAKGRTTDRERLRAGFKERWKPLVDRGAPIHVGEWGCFNKTPHDVCLAWMADNLAVFNEAGWGWALWNLHGSFGVLDSNRADVTYENFRGHKLDRRMLELLRGQA